MLKVVESGAGREAGEQLFELDEIARLGARRMLMAALKTEADDYAERHREERHDPGYPDRRVQSCDDCTGCHERASEREVYTKIAHTVTTIRRLDVRDSTGGIGVRRRRPESTVRSAQVPAGDAK